MSIPIKNVGTVGIIMDTLPHMLPPNAWSDGQNIRFQDGFARRMTGHTPVYGTPSGAPNWLLPVPTASEQLWLYANTTAAFCVDSARNHTDITRLLGPYTGNLTDNWNGGLLQGIPVINNGIDDPQMWNPASPATDLIKLTAWPATTKVKCLRPFKAYLFGMDWEEGGVRYPHKVRWSHAAQPNAVPSSWDVTDPTVDAGQATLPDEGGYVLDSKPLGDLNMVYKEDQIWAFQYVGGQQVFKPVKIASEAGMLTRDCVASFYAGGRRHAVFGSDDLLIHDGNSIQSIADKRMRRWLFNQLDSSNYRRCFVVPNYVAREIWFCFVPTGQTLATMCLPWNYRDGTFSPFREMPGIRYATSGLVNDTAAGITWDTDAGTWDADTGSWDDRLYGSASRKVVMGLSTPTLQMADQGTQFAGVNYTSYLERVGISYSSVDRDGNPKSDMESRKLMTELWPRIEAPAGTQVDIYCGAHDDVNVGVTWQGPFPFIVGTHRKVNPMVAGRFLAVKFQSNANADWALHEYAYDVKVVGKY